MSFIAYIAHPVGDGPDRARNLDNVEKWFLALFRASHFFSYNVPWYIYVRNLTEADRTRAMRDDLAVLRTCDYIILTGGRISAGMKLEENTAALLGIKIIDLTDMGYEAPSLDDESAMTALADRLSEALQ